jgi:hypothetical protein
MIDSVNILQFMSVGATVAATLAAAKTFVNGIEAIRAKKRAEPYLHDRLTIDSELASIAKHASNSTLNPHEIEVALKSIEAAIATMSETDKRLIKEGLHQDSPTGTKRYVRDLLAASAS